MLPLCSLCIVLARLRSFWGRAAFNDCLLPCSYIFPLSLLIPIHSLSLVDTTQTRTCRQRKFIDLSRSSCSENSSLVSQCRFGIHRNIKLRGGLLDHLSPAICYLLHFPVLDLHIVPVLYIQVFCYE